MDISDFLNSINKTKEDVIQDERDERSYVPYVINKCLSYHKDCIFYSNLMNQRSHLDKKLQYDYYRGMVKKGNRYGKWHKPEVSHIESIMAYYGYSRVRAEEVAQILSESQIEALKQALERGGK